MKIVVMGAGGVGGYFGARLAQAGNEVSFIARGRHLEFARLRFGPLMPSQRAAAEAFLNVCQKAGVDAELSEDIVRVIWEKFVLLVGISGATALARRPLGVVRADPDLRWLLECAMRETWQLAQKRGIALPEDFVAKTLAGIDKLPADMKASMAANLEAGGRLEAPWLCGAVARMAEAHGLAAPVNRAIYAALKPYVDGSQSKTA